VSARSTQGAGAFAHGLFGKGAKSKDLAATRGTEYIAYVDGDQTVAIQK
jgi:hypothetical protein